MHAYAHERTCTSVRTHTLSHASSITGFDGYPATQPSRLSPAIFTQPSRLSPADSGLSRQRKISQPQHQTWLWLEGFQGARACARSHAQCLPEAAPGSIDRNLGDLFRTSMHKRARLTVALDPCPTACIGDPRFNPQRNADGTLAKNPGMAVRMRARFSTYESPSTRLKVTKRHASRAPPLEFRVPTNKLPFWGE